MAIEKVIVVGAGPAGLILALLLGKAGIKVQILDQASTLDPSPRASHYSAPAIHELRRAGILDDIQARGFLPNGVTWRDIDGNSMGGIFMEVVPDDAKMVCLPLNQMNAITMDHLERLPQDLVDIKWNHKVKGIDQDEKKARVTVEMPEGERTMEGDYVVGCDGANSMVRRCLFGENFPGMTWNEQIVATNTYYDMSPYKWDDSVFIIDKDHWSMIAKIQTDGMLRITYGELPGLTREQLVERQPMKFASFIPGRPTPDKYKIVNFSPYRVHQRCAESFRVGRILLAADAAHLCNPFGGLGLTGGLVDIGNLYDCLYGIHNDLADDTILDRYSEVRIQKWKDIINPVSSDNIRRMWQDPKKAREEDPFLELCRKVEHDEQASKTMQLGILSVMHDFTKEYKGASRNGTYESSKTGTISKAVPVVAAGSDA